MGFFSNLGDALSGKIYKQNTLVGSNVIKLTKKVENRPQTDFVKQWVYSCVAGINAVVNNLLFEDIKDEKGNTEMTFADGAKQPLNPFKENIGKLDEQKVFEIFKILGGYHLAIFLQNEDNLLFLKKLKLDAAKFEEEIFTIFDFTRADEKIYQELKEKFTKNLINTTIGKSKPAENSVRPRKGVAEGGGWGRNSATPEQKTEAASAALLVRAEHRKKVFFSF